MVEDMSPAAADRGEAFVIHVFVDEQGADRQRLRRLSNELRTTLREPESCEVRFLDRDAGRPAKGVAEYLPGALMVILGITANVPRLARILDYWLTRDRERSVKLENSKTGESIEISGMGQKDVARLIETWRGVARDDCAEGAGDEGGPQAGAGDSDQ